MILYYLHWLYELLMESEPIDFKNIIKEVDKQNAWKATEYDFMKLPRSELKSLFWLKSTEET